jgi:hypothetical protein
MLNLSYQKIISLFQEAGNQSRKRFCVTHQGSRLIHNQRNYNTSSKNKQLQRHQMIERHQPKPKLPLKQHLATNHQTLKYKSPKDPFTKP